MFKFSVPEWSHAQNSIAPLWKGSYSVVTYNHALEQQEPS